MKYRTILADPPWPQGLTGKYSRRQCRRDALPYPTMKLDDIKALNIGELADTDCHLWLWTTNQFLRDGFDVMEAWGFRYLAPITWVKQSGFGNYFVHRTQTLLFGYKDKCRFPQDRYKPTVFFAPSPTNNHSQKPSVSYDFIEGISPEPRLELFSRRKRFGWDVWGNEVYNDVNLNVEVKHERPR